MAGAFCRGRPGRAPRTDAETAACGSTRRQRIAPDQRPGATMVLARSTLRPIGRRNTVTDRGIGSRPRLRSVEGYVGVPECGGWTRQSRPPDRRRFPRPGRRHTARRSSGIPSWARLHLNGEIIKLVVRVPRGQAPSRACTRGRVCRVFFPFAAGQHDKPPQRCRARMWGVTHASRRGRYMVMIRIPARNRTGSRSGSMCHGIDRQVEYLEPRHKPDTAPRTPGVPEWRLRELHEMASLGRNRSCNGCFSRGVRREIKSALTNILLEPLQQQRIVNRHPLP